MAAADGAQRVRDLYNAFASGDRDAAESIFADDFRFSSPHGAGLDRQAYFERRWPGAGQGQRFDFARMVESGDEVIVTYELDRPDGTRGRNTDIFTFTGDRIVGIEAYFGWDVE